MDKTTWIDAHREALCSDLTQLIGYQSVSAAPQPDAPFGSEIAACLDATLALGARLGLRTGRMGGYAGWCEWGEGSEMVAVLAHLDVVPAGEGWSVPPYGGLQRDGRIYGRGAIDDKGPAVAALYALAALKESGEVLPRRVRVLFGTNEESGSAGIHYYVEQGGELPVFGFTPDGAYPVINGEKGIANLDFAIPFSGLGALQITALSAGEAPNSVPASARAELTCPPDLAEQLCAALQKERAAEGKLQAVQTATGLRVTANGRAAHGASPWEGENAAGLLAEALCGLPLCETQRAPLRFLAEKIGTQWDGRALGAACADQPSGAFTCNMGVVVLEGDLLQVRLNLRCPVTADEVQLIETVTAAFVEAGFVRTRLVRRPGIYLAPEHPLIKTLCRVYTDATGEPALPSCIGGGTYAKAMPNLVAFGPVFPGDEVREHQPDEFIEIDRLMQNCHIMAEAITALAHEPAALGSSDTATE